MDVDLLRPWHSARPVPGSVPVFSRATKWQFIRTIASGFYGRQKTIPFILKSYSTLAGLRHLIACCAIVPSLNGKPLDAPRVVSDPARARWWLHRNLVDQLCAIALIRQPRTRMAISMLC